MKSQSTRPCLPFFLDGAAESAAIHESLGIFCCNFCEAENRKQLFQQWPAHLKCPKLAEELEHLQLFPFLQPLRLWFAIIFAEIGILACSHAWLFERKHGISWNAWSVRPMVLPGLWQADAEFMGARMRNRLPAAAWRHSKSPTWSCFQKQTYSNSMPLCFFCWLCRSLKNLKTWPSQNEGTSQMTPARKLC